MLVRRTIFSRRQRIPTKKSSIKISILNKGENSGVCLRSVHFINTCLLSACKTQGTCSNKVLEQTPRYYEDRVISLHTASECTKFSFFSLSSTSHTTSVVPSKPPRTRASLAVNDPLDSHLDANQKVANALTKWS